LLALQNYKSAADEGHTSAQYNLANMYYVGDGIPSNKRLSFNYYEQAANNGHAKAQYYLGLMYESGVDIKLDPKMAIKYYHMAADNDDSRAQEKLGKLYETGGICTKNYQLASFYFCKASVHIEDSKDHLKLILSGKKNSGIPSSSRLVFNCKRLARKCNDRER